MGSGLRYKHATEPVVFDVDDRDVVNTYSVPILDSIGHCYCYAVVQSLGYNRYSAVSGFTDLWQIRDYLADRADAGDTDFRRIYFWEPGTWFGQILVTPVAEWPDDADVRRHARRCQILKQLGADVPLVMGGCE